MMVFIRKGIFLLSLFFSTLFYQALGWAQNDFGQTIQIYTRFHSFVGHPAWLLIIRDMDDGEVFPYLYDINRGDNFWLALTYGRNYQITVSSLEFLPYKNKIDNFCGLEQGTISGQSLYITLNGDLTPNPATFSCHVAKYADSQFTVVPATDSGE